MHYAINIYLIKVTFTARCTCYSPVLCSCEQEMAAPSLDTIVDSLNKIIQLEESIVSPGATVQEALQMRVTVRQYFCSAPRQVFVSTQTKFGSSVTVTVTNFTNTLFSAVRTSTMAGEVSGFRILNLSFTISCL